VRERAGGGESGNGKGLGVSLEIWVSGAGMTDKFISEQARRNAGWRRTELQFIWLGCVTDVNGEHR
jgi:hypothetical protein